MHRQRKWSIERVVVLGAIGVGLMAGSYGIASAASGSTSSPSSASASTTTPNTQPPWGHKRSDETLLTGDNADKVRQLALARVPRATVIRVETDADGNAAYEAHMVDANGTPTTVYVNQQFEVVSVETGMPGPPPGTSSGSSGATA